MIIFLFLNASLRSVYVLFSVLLWSRVIRCFHNIAFLRNKVFVFFPRSKCFDRLRQASTGFDRFRQATRASHSPFLPRKFVNRNCATSLCIIFVLETLLFLVIPLLRIIRTYFLLNLSFLLLLLNKYAIIIMLGNPLRLNNSLLSIRLFDDYSAN